MKEILKVIVNGKDVLIPKSMELALINHIKDIPGMLGNHIKDMIGIGFVDHIKGESFVFSIKDGFEYGDHVRVVLFK